MYLNSSNIKENGKIITPNEKTPYHRVCRKRKPHNTTELEMLPLDPQMKQRGMNKVSLALLSKSPPDKFHKEPKVTHSLPRLLSIKDRQFSQFLCTKISFYSVSPNPYQTFALKL